MIWNLPINKTWGQIVFYKWILPNFLGNYHSNFRQTLLEKRKDNTLPKSTQNQLIPIPKLNEAIKRNENQMPVLLMNIIEFINKISKLILHILKNKQNMMYYDQVGFIPHMQEWVHIIKLMNAIYHLIKLE